MLQENLHIRAVIPHYVGTSTSEVPVIGEGFGSRQVSSRSQRSIAFSRCLQGLLNLRQSPQDAVLDLLTAKPFASPLSRAHTRFASITVEVMVVGIAGSMLTEPLEEFCPFVDSLLVDLMDPKELGFCARDWLISHEEPADLNIYLEDDLVIRDELLPEKIIWLAEKSEQSCVLFPHRYELVHHPKLPPRLYIDGPSNHDQILEWHQAEESFAKGKFQGSFPVVFDIPSNPHSGFFAITRKQLVALREVQLPTQGFVGPLETAATYTIGAHFSILKSSWSDRKFLEVEHAHPSFLGYLYK